MSITKVSVTEMSFTKMSWIPLLYVVGRRYIDQQIICIRVRNKNCFIKLPHWLSAINIIITIIITITIIIIIITTTITTTVIIYNNWNNSKRHLINIQEVMMWKYLMLFRIKLKNK